MNKKNIVTKENIEKVVKFLKESIKWLKEEDQGCCRFRLSSDLALYCGWQSGYDPEDKTVIHSEEDPEYAIVAGVKVRNDWDYADYEFLNFPYYEDTGECWNNELSMEPTDGEKEFKQNAKWFLETFVSMTNAHKKGELCYE